MEGRFYRKKAGGTPITRRLNRKRFILVGLVGIPALLYLVFGSHGILQRIELQGRISELEHKIETVKTDNRRLSAEAKALESDPKMIEKVAREKYGMAREGETVYRIRKPEEQSGR
ncbi:MAG: septum formation initiator family protein [Ignavibacteria bacterium]|nr:septum formation initiator family protein [Ignavibacteria bacterium]